MKNPRQTLKTQIRFRILPPPALRASARKSAARAPGYLVGLSQFWLHAPAKAQR
jgi:hypothetical protein